jgi:hypothetical protein
MMDVPPNMRLTGEASLAHFVLSEATVQNVTIAESG